jgi:hypothetical protein
MITKKVNRYYCEYCNKSGGNAAVIKKHEKHCTLNPNRECGCCDTYLDREQTDLNELMALLPIPDSDNAEQLTKDAIPALMELSGNCPTCIMSALRQKGIPMYWVNDVYNFNKRLDELRKDYLERNRCW